jgi:hypothetical protein
MEMGRGGIPTEHNDAHKAMRDVVKAGNAVCHTVDAAEEVVDMAHKVQAASNNAD